MGVAMCTDLYGQQMDTLLQKLRKIGQDSRHAGCAELYSGMTSLKQEMEEERKQFQGGIMQAKQTDRQAQLKLRQLELALIQVTEASQAASQESERREREYEERLREATQALAQVSADSQEAQKRVLQLEGDFIRTQQKVGNSEVQINEFEQRAVLILSAFEPLPTPRGRLAAFTLKHLSSYGVPRKTLSVSSMSTEETAAVVETGQENVKEQLREIFGEQAYRLRNALQFHNSFSNEVKRVLQGMKTNTQELSRKFESHSVSENTKGGKIAKDKAKRKRNLDPASACTVVDMIDGWKEAKPANGTLPFWYNERTRTVSFTSPHELNPRSQATKHTEESHVDTDRAATDLNTMTDCDILTQTEATSLATGVIRDKMRNDSLMCNGEHIQARRASFGRHIRLKRPSNQPMF